MAVHVARGEASFYLLGLSSNAAPQIHVAAMIEALAGQFGELMVSRICVTAPFGVSEAAPFYNLAVLLRSENCADALKHWCRALEDRLGRDRSSPARRSRVTADIDLLACCTDCAELHRLELADEPYYLPMVAELVALAEGRTPTLVPAETSVIRSGAVELGPEPALLAMQDQELVSLCAPRLLDCRLP